MTETEWMLGDDSDPMLESPQAKVSDRKARLFACACCQRIEELLPAALSAAVQVAERFADGAATDKERLVASRTVKSVYKTLEDPTGPNDSKRLSALQAQAAVAVVTEKTIKQGRSLSLGVLFAAGALAHMARGRMKVGADDPYSVVIHTERAWQAVVLRDIVGNPFRPVAIDSRWRTANVLDLARGIYEDRAFDRLPLLADALMDAGCADDQLLAHCRSDGPHVRGCWVLDLVLERE